MLRGIHWLMVLLAAVPAVCCRRESEAERARQARILLVGNSGEPKGLDPHLVTGVIESKVIGALFEGLVADHPSDDAAFPPGAALEWESFDAAERWVFRLRREGKWSDGAPVTAHDFVFSYHRLLHPLVAGPYAEMLYFLANAERYNKDRRGEILFGGDRDPRVPWQLASGVNFRGEPAMPAAGENDDISGFDDLDQAGRVAWVRARGLDRLDKVQLEWLSAEPERRFEWPADLPAAARRAILERMIARHGADLWDEARVGVRALDDFTLEVSLREPVPYLPALTRHYTWFPVPRHVVLQHGAIHDRFTRWSELPHIVGNGPFRLAAWRFHDRIEVVRNPHYWDAAGVWLHGIHFLPIENPYTEARAFMAGQLHTSYVLPADLIEAVRESRPELLRQEPYVGTTFLRLNTTRPGLDDPRVRAALALAIDREAMCRHVMVGYSPANSFTPRMGDYQGPAMLRFDPAEARRLLAEAGYPGGAGFPRYSILISRPSARAASEAFQAMWKRHLGILVDIQNKDWGSYISAQQNLEFDIASAGWIGDYLDPTTFLNMWTMDNGNNNTGWHSSEYEALLAAAAREADPGDRFATLARAERLFLEAMPVLPVSWYVRNYLHDPKIEGWHPLLLDNHPWKTIRFADR